MKTPPRDVVRRISEALQSAPIRSGSSIRISLRPAHLGGLWIEMSVAGSALKATVRTETEAARDLLLAHLEDLRRSLGALGIEIRDFHVELRRDPAPEKRSGASKDEEEAAEHGPRSHRRQRIDVRA